MTGLDLITLAVAVLAVGGLAIVLGEALFRNPRSLLEMAADSRAFAEAPLAGEQVPTARRSSGAAQAAANQNDHRLAA